ncbi:hypothetical protein PN836_016570 [Ningiella sp. W23]|uniref:hypothetical protein n=1 Tax=Ningiella sp. W23 TaxID=3023715 RepID=UPI00375630C4
MSLDAQASAAKSLIDRCSEVLEKNKSNEKPILRVVHHFACSGGTIITKCLAAMPNVFVLSETHPLSKNHVGHLARYSPTDITTLSRFAGIPDLEKLAIRLFITNIKAVNKHVSERGGTLVLREHTHIDYCVGKKIARAPIVETCLDKDFEIISLATVRNPIDSYISLQTNNWLQFKPATFDEYCKRLFRFLSRYPLENIVKYEDFTKKPHKAINRMCKILNIKFDGSFSDITELFTMTGDSGRASNKIEKRERRDISDDFRNEIHSSAYFQKVKSLLCYTDY